MAPRVARPTLLRVAAMTLPTLVLVASVAAAQALAPTTAPTAVAPTAATAVPTAPTAPSAAPSAVPAPAPPAPPPEKPDVEALRDLSAKIRALLEETLDPAVEPQDLFDVRLDDARALAVEVERLRRVLAEARPPEVAPEAPDGDAGAPPDEGEAGAPEGANGPPEPTSPPPEIDPDLFAARVALDRARLAFYELPAERRTEILAAHAKRRAESAEAQTKKELSDAEAAQQKAAQEKQHALEQARNARSRAEKLVNEELASLYDLKGQYAELDQRLITAEAALDKFDETLLSWTLPADEILRASFEERPDPATIDRVYDAVTEHLDETRNALDAALSGADYMSVPPVGESALSELPVKVDTSKVDALRAELVDTRRKLEARVDQLHFRRSSQQLEALTALDERRLGLIALLSSDKRAQLRGLDTEALRQAKNELEHVALLLRYHLLATRRFVAQVRTTGETGDSTIIALVTALKWLLPIGLFVWWRRRAKETLDRWREAAEELASKQAIPRGFSRGERAVAFVRKVRQPFEWLLLAWAVIALLPTGAAALLEVQLLSTILTWTLGGWLVVAVIDALLSDEAGRRKTALQTGLLRWRTLRLLGRVVVSLGLFLALTQQLVGKGTIYSWAVQIAWILGIGVALVVVRWWRHIIFHHVGVQRKKGPILRWVERTEEGWGSFVAAVVGGLYLLGQGAMKLIRQQLGGVDLVKRLLAYWFRREVTRQAEKQDAGEAEGRLDKKVYRALDPEMQPPELVASVADAQVEDVIARVNQPGGGVFAIVGERGAGKSTLLRRIIDQTENTTIVQCPATGIEGFRLALRKAIGVADDTPDADLKALFAKWPKNSALLIDDAHHLVRPVVDGLDEIDPLLALARSASSSCTWVFAFDAVIWQLFARAREVRPLFDDIVKLTPWSEDGIVRLLESRSEQAGLEADFSALVTEMPEDADDIDIEEALNRAQRGYYRLLWDYSLGNPAVSLHFWRASLRRDPQGHHLVRLFEPPRTDDLERLPDSTVFVLRAVVQLDLATVDDIVEATMLERNQVEDGLRYALGRRYLEMLGGRYRVRWTWFRTVTRFLSRRHLLMGPYQ